MYKIEFINQKQEQVYINLLPGQNIYILGSNGVGKSALIHKIRADNNEYSTLIQAQRQNTLNNNYNELLPSHVEAITNDLKYGFQTPSNRYKDVSPNKNQLLITKLIDFENTKARKTLEALKNDDSELAKKLSNIPTPIEIINEIFKLSAVNIEISINDDQKILASKNNSTPYEITKLSDGERNALILIMDIMTCEQNSLIIIDVDIPLNFPV